MKSPRVYEQLAVHARDHGYDCATGWTVQHWGRSGLLPPMPKGPTRRGQDKISAEHRDRVLAICRYRYDAGIDRLAHVGILLWLDGARVPTDRLRDWLESIAEQPERIVSQLGGRARSENPDDPDADVLAAAGALSHKPDELVRLGGRVPTIEEMDSGVQELLAVATGRTPATDADRDAFAAIASAAGMDRAKSEGQLTDGDPARELAASVAEVFVTARPLIEQVTAGQLDAARTRGARLHEIAAAAAPMIELGWDTGHAGLGAFLATGQGNPHFGRILLVYAALLRPAGAAELARAITDDQLAEWRDLTARAREWMASNPDRMAEVRKSGLKAVLDLEIPGSPVE